MKAIEKLETYLESIEKRIETLNSLPNQNSTEIKVEAQTLLEVKSDISVIVTQLKNQSSSSKNSMQKQESETSKASSLKKDEIVTVVSIKDNTVVIQDTRIVSSGAMRTVFECFIGYFETPTITPTIESIEEDVRCFTCIAPNEDFITRYIEVAKEQRTRGINRAKENLKKSPDSSRYKRHLKLYEKEITVNDLREEK